MALATKTFRIFVSSTFSDLKEERNALQKWVFPRLRELCMQYRCRFQAIDLRWGIREEASLDQQTMKICLDEIDRCQVTTPRPNFIVLLGDRYGWQPLPERIPEREFKQIKATIEAHKAEFDKIARKEANIDALSLLDKWYKRDDNALSPVYILQPREEKFVDYETWEKEAQRPLLCILREAMKDLDFTEDDRLKYMASATHQEIESGAMKVDDCREHVFGFFRCITNLEELKKSLPGKPAKDFVDTDAEGNFDVPSHQKLLQMKKELQGRLGEKNIYNYEAQWKREGISMEHIGTLPEKLADCEKILAKGYVPLNLCEAVWCALAPVIRAECEQIESKESLELEKEAQAAFLEDRAKFFIGRESMLQSINDYIKGSDSHTFAVHGAPGSGKSALIAKAIELVQKDHSNEKTVFRFIGATPESSDGRALLESLCRQISQYYKAEESDIPTDYKELVEEFPKRLALATADSPLIVFLDALDQLSDAHNARNLLWLPSDLPENVRLIVSALPGECKSALEKKLPGENLVELEPMPVEEGEKLLDLWLESEKVRRTLQKNQREEVLGKFKQNGLPLYLKLAFEEARRWKSYTKDIELSPDIAGIIRDLFSRLSSDANHGEMIVSRSLGYIAAAKNGLSEDEVLDVLSEDEEVFKNFMERAFHKPPEKRLPVIVWSRLYFDLEPYLTERSADGTSLMAFYHPTTIGKEVVEKYLTGKARLERHLMLAHYFGAQKLFIEKDDQKTPNLRKLSELPYQQTYGKIWDGLYETLTDFEFLEAKCTYLAVTTTGEGDDARKVYGGVYELIEDYRRALEEFPSSKDVK